MTRSSLFKQILNTTPDGVTIQDKDFNILYQNDAVKRMFGDQIGLKCYAVYEKRVQVCEDCGLLRVFETGASTVVHRTAIRKDGKAHQWENACFPLFDDAGNIIAGVEVCRNVTSRVSLTEDVRRRSIELGKLNDQLNRKSTELESAYNDLKIAQSRILQQEELLRAIIEAAPVAIIGMDLDGNVHSVWNRAAERMLGWSASEVIGRPLPTVPVDKAEEFRRFREQIQKGMTLNGVEVRRQRRDGTPIDYSIYASSLRDLEGNISGNIAVLVDITKHKRQEAMLKESEERFRTLFDNGPDAYFIMELDGGRISACNRAAESMLGGDRTHILGKTPDQLSPERQPDGRLSTAAAADRIVEALKKGGHNFEWVYRKLDGTDFWVHVTASVMSIESRTALLVSWRDIQNRKRAETALRESETRLWDIALSTSDWFWEVDAEGRYTYCSDGVQEILGFRPDELFGKTPLDFMPPEEAARVGEVLGEVVAKKKPIENFENWNLARNGRRVCLLTNGLPILDRESNLCGYRGAGQDITERKRLEDEQRKLMAELKRSNAELEQFAYVASHDLQEPLRKVGCYMELVTERYREQLDQDARELIDYAVDGARRMKVMIEDLLVYSRVGTKGKSFAPVDMMHIMQDVLSDLELTIRENDAVVSYNCLPVVTADDAQLQQLFRNLIGNALKYRGEDPPQIRVSAERQEQAWRICVKDNGIGIDPRFFERIFQIFQRLHPRDRYEGTGIGLAVCKKIVERRGGTIGVESTPDQGSAFYFTIPDIEEDI